MIDFYKKCLHTMLRLAHARGFTHIGSSLSAMLSLAYLFRRYYPFASSSVNGQIALRQFGYPKLILSKGHAVPALYACLIARGAVAFERVADGFSSEFEFEHPTIGLESVITPTGSLGHGLGVGCGIAEAQLRKGVVAPVFVILGDGEVNEGSVWESAIYAGARKLGALIAFIDFNGWQATGRSTDLYSSSETFSAWKNLGWNVNVVDYRGFQELSRQLDGYLAITPERPTLVVINAPKGCGISFMEDDNNWHYRKLDDVSLAAALAEVERIA